MDIISTYIVQQMPSQSEIDSIIEVKPLRHFPDGPNEEVLDKLLDSEWEAPILKRVFGDEGGNPLLGDRRKPMDVYAEDMVYLEEPGR